MKQSWLRDNNRLSAPKDMLSSTATLRPRRTGRQTSNRLGGLPPDGTPGIAKKRLAD